MSPATPDVPVDRPPVDGTVAAVTGLGRRSLVRAGAVGAGALWVAPVVTLVAAAPAMAASTTLSLTSLAATYLNSTNPATVRPDLLTVTAILGNHGGQPTSGYQLVLSIPAGLFTSVGATPASGFSAPTVSGSQGTGWTLVFAKSGSQIAAGGSVPFATTLTLGSTTATPYLGFRGAGFALVATASATGTTAIGQAVPVAATPPASLSAGLEPEVSSTNGPAFTMKAGTVYVSEVQTASRSGIGQLFVSVSLPVGKKNSRLSAEPTQGAIGPGWVADGTAHTATAWVFRYRTTAMGYAGSLGPNDASRGPGTFSSALTLNGGKGNPSGVATWTFTADHLTTRVVTARF